MKLALEWKTVKERQIEIAERIKKQRKALKLSRDRLSVMSGIPSPTIRHFEDTGNISLYALVAIAVAMDHQADLDFLFKDIQYLDFRDMINND